MANPTTAKPTNVINEWLATPGTIGELMRCCTVLTAVEPFRDVVGSVLAEPWVGVSTGTGGGVSGYGHPPSVVNAFTQGDVTNQPVARFGAGSTALRVPGRGFTGLTNGQTVWVVFKPMATARPAAATVTVCGSGSTAFMRGVAYSIATNGTISLGRVYAGAFSSSSITLTSGKTYVVSQTRISGTSILTNVYCYDDQAYITPSGTGTTFTVTNEANDSGAGFRDFVIGCNPGYNGYSAISFIGDIYAAGLSDASFDPASNSYFAELIADPCIAARGTYAGGGGLVAGGCTNYDDTSSSIIVHSNRPSGGTPASYQYRLHRSTLVSFTPDITTRIGSLQASPIFTDLTAVAGVSYCYKIEQTDGSSTVYSTTATVNSTQAFGSLSKGDFFFGLIADSRWSSAGADAPLALCQSLRNAGWRCGFVNMGMGSTSVWNSGSASLSWQPNTTQDPVNGQSGTTLLSNAITAFSHATNITYVLSPLGANDALSNTAASVFSTRYGYIRSVVVNSGYTMVLSAPYQTTSANSESAPLRVQEYVPALASLDNGTSCRALSSDSYNVSMTGLEALASDHLHYSDPGLDGDAVSRAILSLIAPTTSLSPSQVKNGDVYYINGVQLVGTYTGSGGGSVGAGVALTLDGGYWYGPKKTC